jgi:hypothetical protein
MINGEQVDEVTAQQNTAAFLAAITYGEGTRGDNGYRTLCVAVCSIRLQIIRR